MLDMEKGQSALSWIICQRNEKIIKIPIVCEVAPSRMHQEIEGLVSFRNFLAFVR